MADANVSVPLPPTQIEGTVQSIARLHAEHPHSATPFQCAVDLCQASSSVARLKRR